MASDDDRLGVAAGLRLPPSLAGSPLSESDMDEPTPLDEPLNLAAGVSRFGVPQSQAGVSTFLLVRLTRGRIPLGKLGHWVASGDPDARLVMRFNPGTAALWVMLDRREEDRFFPERFGAPMVAKVETEPRVRLLIPAGIRHAMGLDVSDQVMVAALEGELLVWNPTESPAFVEWSESVGLV